MAVQIVEPGRALLDAAVVTLLALAVAALGRRRLPAGVSEGLFVGALSALLLLNYAARAEAPGRAFLLAASLVSLAILWLVAAVWVERKTDPDSDADTSDRRTVRRELSTHAAVVAGLLAAAVLTAGEPRRGDLSTPALLTLLTACAASFYIWRRRVLARYAAIAAFVLLLLRCVQPALAPVMRARLAVSAVPLSGGLAILLIVIASLLADWRRRVRIWRTTPERLIEPPPAHRLLYWLVIAACIGVGVAGLPPAGAVAPPVAVLLAAYASFVVGHRWRSNSVGELGLALVVESIVMWTIAWLPTSPARALFGAALAGVFLLWLARFWHQQLNDGQPWTTAGRLIPAARHLSYATVGLQLILATHWILSPAQLSTAGRWEAGLAALLMLLHWSALVRDAELQKSSTPALAAGVVLLAALVPIRQLATAGGFALPFAGWLAVAGLLLAVRAPRWATVAETTWAYNAYIGAVIPLAALYDLTLRGAWLASWRTAIIAILTLVLAAAARWGTRVMGHR